MWLFLMGLSKKHKGKMRRNKILYTVTVKGCASRHHSMATVLYIRHSLQSNQGFKVGMPAKIFKCTRRTWCFRANLMYSLVL